MSIIPTNKLPIPEQHQKRIALATLKLSEIGASIIGGMDHLDAVRVLRRFGYNDIILKNKLIRYGHNPRDIERMLAA